jgi:hypothetical protein
MCASSFERAKYGPGWFEVLFVAWIGLVFGVLLACVHLILRPVPSGADIPKELPPGLTTYVEGTRDGLKAASLAAKRKALLEGRSVELDESEINMALVNRPPESRKLPNKPKKPDPANEPFLQPGQLNFRVHGGLLQIALPVRIALADANVILQTRGVFEKTSSGVVFVPRETYVGNLPLHMIPGAQQQLLQRLMAAYPRGEEVSAAWDKLESAEVVGSVVKLQMP